MTLPILPDGKEVHLWLSNPQDVRSPEQITACLSLLNESERIRLERITHKPTQQTHLVTRALVRTTLSRYAQTPADDWRFVENTHHKPSIEPAQNPANIHFNVSHTEGLIALAIANGVQVGVDVENTTLKRRTVQLADRFFSPPEVTALRALSEAKQRDRFFDLWTLKESYIKGRGLGLAIPLATFSFDLDTASGIAFTVDPSQNDNPDPWFFALGQATPMHRLALGVRAGADITPTIRAWHKVEPPDGPFDEHNLQISRMTRSD